MTEGLREREEEIKEERSTGNMKEQRREEGRLRSQCREILNERLPASSYRKKAGATVSLVVGVGGLSGSCLCIFLGGTSGGVGRCLLEIHGEGWFLPSPPLGTAATAEPHL